MHQASLELLFFFVSFLIWHPSAPFYSVIKDGVLITVPSARKLNKNGVLSRKANSVDVTPANDCGVWGSKILVRLALAHRPFTPT